MRAAVELWGVGLGSPFFWKENQGKKGQGPEAKAKPIEEKGSHGFHAHTLRDEGETPDRGGQQEGCFGAEGFSIQGGLLKDEGKGETKGL